MFSIGSPKGWAGSVPSGIVRWGVQGKGWPYQGLSVHLRAGLATLTSIQLLFGRGSQEEEDQSWSSFSTGKNWWDLSCNSWLTFGCGQYASCKLTILSKDDKDVFSCSISYCMILYRIFMYDCTTIWLLYNYRPTWLDDNTMFLYDYMRTIHVLEMFDPNRHIWSRRTGPVVSKQAWMLRSSFGFDDDLLPRQEWLFVPSMTSSETVVRYFVRSFCFFRLWSPC